MWLTFYFYWTFCSDGVTEHIYFSVLVEELNASCGRSLAYKISMTQHSIPILAVADTVKGALCKVNGDAVGRFRVHRPGQQPSLTPSEGVILVYLLSSSPFCHWQCFSLSRKSCSSHICGNQTLKMYHYQQQAECYSTG